MASLAISQTPTPQARTGPDTDRTATPAEAFLALINRFMTGGEAIPADPSFPTGIGKTPPEEDAAREDGAPAPLVAGLFLAGLPADPPASPDASPAVPSAAPPADGAQTPDGQALPARDAATGAEEGEDASAAASADAMAAAALAAAAQMPSGKGAEAGTTDAETGAGPSAKPAGQPVLPATVPEAEPSLLAGHDTPDAEAARRPADSLAAGEAGNADAASDPADAAPPRTDQARMAANAEAGGRDSRGSDHGSRDKQEERAAGHRTADGADGADGNRPAGSRDSRETRASGSAGTAPATPGGTQPPATDTGKPSVTFAQALDAARQSPDPAAVPGGGTGTLTLRPAGDQASALPGNPPGHAGQPHPASEMVSVHIGRMAETKTGHMRIQLRPVELGAVEVKLDFGKDGTVHASVVADRADTLDLLQKDARSLEKALNDAGFRTGNEGLSFNLRGDQGGERNFAGFRQAFGRQNGRSAGKVDGLDPATARQMTFLAGAGTAAGSDRIDIRI